MQSTLAADIEFAVAAALRALSQEEKAGVYALSFYISDDDDDPRNPTLMVGFNTEAQCKASVAEASSADEARWNFAFWLQNCIASFGERESDSAGAAAEWIAAQGLAYTDADEAADYDRCMDLGGRIVTQFVELSCGVARRLHETGVVESVFGRSIPILVHELEYYDEIAEQTASANPPGVAAAFVAWVEGGCE